MTCSLGKLHDDESIRASSICYDYVDIYVDFGDNIPEYNEEESQENKIKGANSEGANDEGDLALISDDSDYHDSDGFSTDEEYIEAKKKLREYRREVKKNGEPN